MTQPEVLQAYSDAYADAYSDAYADAEAELRRLHELNQELLAALKDVYENCDWYADDGRKAMLKARAAIGKAEGETK